MSNEQVPLSEGDVNLSARRSGWADRHIGPETRKLLDEDSRWFLHQSLSTPCLNALSSSDGPYITDIEGRRYLDFHGNSVHQVGYRHPKVLAAVRDALETLPFSPRRYTNSLTVDLARRLGHLAPGNLTRSLFAPGGAEAMGIAVKLARMATGRFKTISMWDSFHGASLDMISLGGESLFRTGAGPLLPGAAHVPPAGSTACPFGCGGDCTLLCADYIEYVLKREGDVAAVIAEPVRSTVVGIPPAAYWRKVRALCDRYGALLIFDEIPTCLGRTGKMFSCEHFDVVPDILVLGKGLGGAVMPVAAVIAGDALNIAGDRALGHYTHEKSPLAAAAAIATLDVIEEENLLERSRLLGERMLEWGREMQRVHPLVGSVRGLGLLTGLDIVRPGTREPAEDQADTILYAALSRGLSFKVSGGSVLTLAPPLTITDNQLAEAQEILAASIAEVERAI